MKNAIFEELIENNESINNELCKLIDSLTDENNNALPYVSKELVSSIREIAYSVYRNGVSIEYYKDNE